MLLIQLLCKVSTVAILILQRIPVLQPVQKLAQSCRDHSAPRLEILLLIFPQTLCYSLSRLCVCLSSLWSFIPLLQSLFSSSGNDLDMISRIPLAFQILNIQDSESGLPEQFCYRKLNRGQTINSVKTLLGHTAQRSENE